LPGIPGDQTRFAAEAEAYRTRALAEAQAEAIRARADSLREGNAELIAASRLIEILPSLVEAAARGLAESNLTVLNGTQDVNEVVAGLVGQGLTILDTLKKSTAVTGHGVTGNGAAPVPVSAVARAD
jgi:flotillin